MYNFFRGTSKVGHLNEMSLHFLSWYSLYIVLYLACYFCLVFRISSLQIVSPGNYLIYFRKFVIVSLVIQSFLFSLNQTVFKISGSWMSLCSYEWGFCFLNGPSSDHSRCLNYFLYGEYSKIFGSLYLFIIQVSDHIFVVVVQSLSCVQLFATPWSVAPRLLCPWDFPSRNTGAGCHFLLQGIFPTQGWNLRLPWQADSLPLSHIYLIQKD